MNTKEEAKLLAMCALNYWASGDLGSPEELWEDMENADDLFTSREEFDQWLIAHEEEIMTLGNSAESILITYMLTKKEQK